MVGGTITCNIDKSIHRTVIEIMAKSNKPEVNSSSNVFLS